MMPVTRRWQRYPPPARDVRRPLEPDQGDGALAADTCRGRALGAAIERSGQLPKGLLPLVYLRVATLNGCPF
jgi:alkylhydroperoxidase family enzyme